MTRIDWVMLAVLLAIVVVLAAIAIYGRIRRDADAEFLEDCQRRADERLAEYRRQKFFGAREEARQQLRARKGLER